MSVKIRNTTAKPATPAVKKRNDLSENISLPVKAICVIGRGEVNSIGVIPFGQAFAAMYRQSYRPPNAEGLSLMLDMLNEVCRRVTFYSLKCNISEEAAEIAYNTMK